MELVHEMLDRFELEWERQQELDQVDLHWLLAIMLFLTACLGGMRGYEVVSTNLGGLIHDIQRSESEEDFTSVGWPIVGCFKMEGRGIGGHVIPIASTTKSGVKFFKWAQRFSFTLISNGRAVGWAFVRNDGPQTRASDYKEIIFWNWKRSMEKIQDERPDLIDPAVEVWEDYRIQRSGCWFFDTACGLRGVAKHNIEAQCRWMRDRQARGNTVPRDMVDCYTVNQMMKPVLLHPSLAL